ncbi:MAG TPA: HNH endonuclease [Candidatus Hydrogenedentes bacterium]|nr:HNH endonuclease [Candidatus Hydrogenedentota bacterium]
MISRLGFVFLVSVFLMAIASGQDVPKSDDFIGASIEKHPERLVPLGRPFLLRSDVLSDINYLELRRLSRLGANPRTGVLYDWRGFPKFKSTFDVQLEPSQFRAPSYGTICNQQLLSEIERNPALRAQFTERDIELLKIGKNPEGKHWHHDPRHKGRMQLVDSTDHSTHHVGGDKVWGSLDERAFARATVVRWGSVAVLDIAISSAALAYSGDLNFDHFAQAVSRSLSGGIAAFGTEYLLVRFVPQTVGMPPGWFVGLPVLYSGPAALVATVSYAAARALVDYCWEAYRLHQLQIQEQACREVEEMARWQCLRARITTNNDALAEILNECPNSEDIPG